MQLCEIQTLNLSDVLKVYFSQRSVYTWISDGDLKHIHAHLFEWYLRQELNHPIMQPNNVIIYAYVIINSYKSKVAGKIIKDFEPSALRPSFTATACFSMFLSHCTLWIVDNRRAMLIVLVQRGAKELSGGNAIDFPPPVWKQPVLRPLSTFLSAFLIAFCMACSLDSFLYGLLHLAGSLIN